MGEPMHVRLPTDILQHILDYIQPGPVKPVAVDRRRFLSVESFDVPSDSPPGSVTDVGRFRAACREFAELGAPLLFRQVTVRFSSRGLQRLEELSRWAHLTRHVTKFTYLVPLFFENGADDVDSIQSLLLQAEFDHDAADGLKVKAQEQRSILASREDARVLNIAIASFTSLQFIKLLRVSNVYETRLIELLRTNDEARRSTNLNWTIACSHASSTIGKALLDSEGVPWSRFSSPMLSPASVRFLRTTNSLSTLAERLTCLALHFDDSENLEFKMQSLSGLFGDLFRRAPKMENVHLGFPSSHPLTLPLEQIFHNVIWEKLVAFGIQGWELDAVEIVHFLRRHKVKLRGLRLRDILLKDGSTWMTVLGCLHDEMQQLKWVSLRGIGYSQYFHSQETGVEVRDTDPALDSSDSEDEELYDVPTTDPSHDVNLSDDTTSDAGSASFVDSHGGSDSEREMVTSEMEFPPLNSPVTSTFMALCTCNGQTHVDGVENLDDDGISVDDVKRKYWEKWVLRHCPIHGRK